ncbi:hypothetical protein EDB87DRAFT_960935 [Lactarius vividus]|nr:hypothetical protein EDB87DRAFT_960935 [Lactarius vividus]
MPYLAPPNICLQIAPTTPRTLFSTIGLFMLAVVGCAQYCIINTFSPCPYKSVGGIDSPTGGARAPQQDQHCHISCHSNMCDVGDRLDSSRTAHVALWPLSTFPGLPNHFTDHTLTRCTPICGCFMKHEDSTIHIVGHRLLQHTQNLL